MGDREAANKKPKLDPRRRASKPSKKDLKSGGGAPEDDAYGELFPSAMLNGVGIGTGEQGDSDAEDEKEETQNKIKKMKNGEGDSLAANQKAEARKRKVSETQELQ